MNDRHEVSFLLVDDDEIDVISMQRAMKKQRIVNPLLVARDGVEALEILRGQHPDTPRPASVIVLLDLNMPRMNGHEFLNAIRGDESLSRLVVFVLTSSRHERDIHQAYEQHVAGYIVKDDISNGGLAKALGLLDSYWRVVELPVTE